MSYEAKENLEPDGTRPTRYHSPSVKWIAPPHIYEKMGVPAHTGNARGRSPPRKIEVPTKDVRGFCTKARTSRAGGGREPEGVDLDEEEEKEDQEGKADAAKIFPSGISSGTALALAVTAAIATLVDEDNEELKFEAVSRSAAHVSLLSHLGEATRTAA